MVEVEIPLAFGLAANCLRLKSCNLLLPMLVILKPHSPHLKPLAGRKEAVGEFDISRRNPKLTFADMQPLHWAQRWQNQKGMEPSTYFLNSAQISVTGKISDTHASASLQSPPTHSNLAPEELIDQICLVF